MAKSKDLAGEAGLIILVDLYGASPYNASMRCLPEWQALGLNVRIISGMSLPMVVTALCSREFSALDELAAEVVTAGKENIQDAIAALNSQAQTAGDDDY